MKKSKNKISRRDVLKGAVNAGLAAALLPLSGFSNAEQQRSTLIVAENKKQGTTDWQLTYVKSEELRSKEIEGYCSKMSLRAGESIDILWRQGWTFHAKIGTLLCAATGCSSNCGTSFARMQLE
jgi:hypothetical protein